MAVESNQKPLKALVCCIDLPHFLVKGLGPKLCGLVFLDFCYLDCLYAACDKLKRPNLVVISNFIIFLPPSLCPPIKAHEYMDLKDGEQISVLHN